MAPQRLAGLAAPCGFLILVATLLAIGAVTGQQAGWAAASVAAAFVPTGIASAGGARRRLAEAMLLAPACSLSLCGEATWRHMLTPPLLVVAAVAATLASHRRVRDRVTGPILVGALAVAVRAAGEGLVGQTWTVAAVVLALCGVLGWSAARSLGWELGVSLALVVGSIAWETAPIWLLLALLLPAAAASRTRRPRAAARLGQAWLPAAVLVATLSSVIAPWGGMTLGRAFPSAWRVAPGVGLLVLASAPFLPPAVAGAAWLAAAPLLGPAQVAPPERPSIELTATAPHATLPTATGGTYMLDAALANAGDLPPGTVVATVRVGGVDVPIRAGVEAAEWAHERADVRADVAHPLPEHPVWRPTGLGRTALWGVAGRTAGEVPAGVVPQIVRVSGLPERVTVIVSAAGPSGPPAERDWGLGRFLAGAALAVAILQLAGATWAGRWAWVPWVLLAVPAWAARLPIEPLRFLVERHGMDAALAALLTAWLPVAIRWLRDGRRFAAAAALLLPLAIATPHLVPPAGDEPYHLLLLSSIRQDFDLDVSNNLDLAHHPENAAYGPTGWFLHSPVFAMLLLPGFLLAGRTGASVMMAVAGAALVAGIARRAVALGAARRVVDVLAMALLLSYPLATFSTQLWPEVPAALAACGLLFLASPERRQPWPAAGIAVLATWVKTRLGLLTVPLALAAWPLEGGRRDRVRLVAATCLTAAAALALGWIWFGNPLDPVGRRHLGDLVPASLGRVVTALGGLAFDAAGGLAFSAPLALAALAGLALLWRRGGRPEKALLIGGAFTVLALLNNLEWRGGDSPAARYLVPLLPIFALSGAMVASRTRPWRPLLALLVPPTLIAWWVFVTRPQLGINTGTGGFWLSDILAERFGVGARLYFPSFLRPSVATWFGPVILVAGAALLVTFAVLWPRGARAVARGSVAIWLAAAATLLVAMHTRYDRVVQFEDPQVVHLGGMLEPFPGQMSRFLFRNGWRVWHGQGVQAPVHVPPGAQVLLEGWAEGPARTDGTLLASWDGGPASAIALAPWPAHPLDIPTPAGGGRLHLRLILDAPNGGRATFDELLVTRR